VRIAYHPGMSTTLDVRNVTKIYATPAGSFTALDAVDLQAGPGEFVAVMGPSGSGKSTLLGLLAGIDRPNSGTIEVCGAAVHTLNERALTAWRGRQVGIVFQFFQLLPTLTALENVLLPMDLCSMWPKGERRGRATALLEQCGVADQADKLPATLSGGQQQRVAIARSLANDPALILADEPTGNLDARTSEIMLSLLGGVAQSGKTVVLVTHETRAVEHVTRVVHLADGRVVPEFVS